MVVNIMLCFARSGGTLLNRLLGSHPDVYMLSEVNPIGVHPERTGKYPLTSIPVQAKQWYDIEIKNENFSDQILEFSKIASSKGKQIIVRDWSFICFVPTQINTFSPPNEFSILQSFSSDIEIRCFGFVRNAIDVWLSGRPLMHMKTFFPAYRRYVEELIKLKVPIFTYENMCKDPEEECKKILTYLDLRIYPIWESFSSNKNAVGDLGRKSRGDRIGKVKSFKRQFLLPIFRKSLNTNVDMIEANRLLQYGIKYENESHETFLNHYSAIFKKKTTHYLHKFFGKKKNR
jgi:hypothetical protein